METTNKTKNKFEIDMTSGNLFFKILLFSLPLAAMGVLQLLYNAADLIVVSNFSNDSEALGAVGSTSTLINLVVNLFMGLSVGTNVLCAHHYGAKHYDRMRDVVHTSLLISFISGLVLGIFGFIFAGSLLHLMHNDLYLSKLYLKIYFIGMPFNMLFNFAAAILRAVGDTKRPLYYLTIAGIINVLLNLLFVIVFKMSVAGVALATIIAQFISCLLTLITLYKTKEPYRFRFKELKINPEVLKQIAKVGLPAGIQSSIFSMSNVIIQSSVNLYGVIGMNGNTAAQSVEGFVYTSMNSVYHAALAFTGQNYGAKNTKNIKKVTLNSLIIVTGIAFILGGSLFLIGRSVLSIYTKVPAEIEIGYIRLHYLCLPYFLCGIMDVMVGVLRGLGFSTLPMLVTIIGVCGFRIVWIYTIFYSIADFADPTTLNYLYISYPISWIITFLAHLICYFTAGRKVIKKLSNNNMQMA